VIADKELYGATPLTAEERQGLIPSHVTLRRELDELENRNILEAALWSFERRRNPVSESFGKNLHKRMFKNVWSWAGDYRRSNKNIGVDKTQILVGLYQAFDNFEFWIKEKTFSFDEVGVRFHHDLVFIHPFANGNGRWSRLMADILMTRLEAGKFSWGRSDLRGDDIVRRAYIDALKAADRQDYGPLLRFARS
jgi:Fic-DOC domain mobile mystery protein B